MFPNIVVQEDIQTYKHTYKHMSVCFTIVEETFRINTEFLCLSFRRREIKDLKYHGKGAIMYTFPWRSEDEAWEVTSGFTEITHLRKGFKG